MKHGAFAAVCECMSVLVCFVQLCASVFVQCEQMIAMFSIAKTIMATAA